MKNLFRKTSKIFGLCVPIFFCFISFNIYSQSFSDVTSDTLIGWIQDSITSDELAKIDNIIAAKLLNRNAVETNWS